MPATPEGLRPSPVLATVDYDRDGIQHGFLRLPYSRDDSAWGSVVIPITVIRNGEGPTALLTGANHGDEYEGPLALFDLAARIKAPDVTGRIILVPAMNYPAFGAGTRTSPIDRGNLNRSFPGRPDGTVTQKIADYFQRVLLPCDPSTGLHCCVPFQLAVNVVQIFHCIDDVASVVCSLKINSKPIHM